MSFKKMIKEIEKNPCLWNPNCKDYSNTLLKQFIWEQVTTTVFNCDTEKDPEKMVRYLKRKWTNLKNSYHQWFSSKNSTSKTKIKKSAYDDLLKFLDPVFERPRRSTKKENADIQEATRSEVTRSETMRSEATRSESKRKSTSNGSKSSKTKSDNKSAPVNVTVVLPEISGINNETERKIKSEPATSSSIENKPDDNTLIVGNSYNQHHHDSDKSLTECNGNMNFLSSISLYIKAFNDDQRLEFKTNVLKIIQKIKHSSYSVPPQRLPLPFSQCLPSTSRSNLGRSSRNCSYTFDVLHDEFNINFNRPPPPLRLYPNFNIPPPPPTHGFITLQPIPTPPPLSSITDGGGGGVGGGVGNALIPLQHNNIGHSNRHSNFQGNFQSPNNGNVYDPSHVTSTTDNFTTHRD